MAPWYTVQQGEDVLSIAKKHGFEDWRIIYDHAENADFRQQRPDPTILAPGDTLFIPNRSLKQEACQTGQKHTFVVKYGTALLRIVLEDDNQPYATKKYELKVGNQTYTGTTDDQGLLVQKVKLDAETGALQVWLDDDPSAAPTTWTLQLAHLDPIGTISGVQARLANLGYDCSDESGTIGPQTTRVLKAFQAVHGLEPTGQLDDTTRAKLKEQHDSP